MAPTFTAESPHRSLQIHEHGSRYEQIEQTTVTTAATRLFELVRALTQVFLRLGELVSESFAVTSLRPDQFDILAEFGQAHKSGRCGHLSERCAVSVADASA